MVCLLVYGFLFQLAFNHASANSRDDNLGTGSINGHRCNSHGVCLPGAEDIALSPRVILADNTCGSPPYDQYCPPVEGTACFGCNSTSVQESHPAQFMIDRGTGISTSNFETWWQSQNWWEWSQQHNQGPLTVNITISFNKSYVLTGDIRVTFKFTKPKKMVLEKSTDFGQTWIPLQYFADDCQNRFGMEPSDLNCSTNAVLCNEKYRGQVEGPVYFSFLNCYTRQTFWDPNIQNLTEATDLKLRLEFPETDGLHINTQEEYLQKYFYAISDIQVFGRCQCHGHGRDCKFPEDRINGGYLNEPSCICQHNTEGKNCERCEALYNNKTWMPATSMDQPNQCEKCECHEHTQSCTFNSTLAHGTCDNCEHNTRGYFCEQCDDKFYRNLSRALDDDQVCLDCNCTLDGITNNGSCSQEVATIGQCECKQNVTGRRCDRCEDAYYGYTNHPVGNCIACQCNQYGTVNGSLNCHQVTGQCSCKENIDQRTCSQCELGYYKFPNTTDGDCFECVCDSGGTTPDFCEKDQGKCLCRFGIQDKECSSVTTGRFFPKYDYFLYEAEYQPGNYTITSNASEYDIYFTGRGYAEIKDEQYIKFEISVGVKSNFSIILRYSYGVGSLKISLQGNETLECPQVDRNFTTGSLQNDTRTASWNSSESYERVLLCPGVNYTIQAEAGEPSTSAKVDSLLLVPDLPELNQSNNASSKPTNTRRSRNAQSSVTVNYCLSKVNTIEDIDTSASVCKGVTFSTMVKLFNGSLACECSAIGANTTECEPYGGQCVCKPGVMGRTCDRCKPGFYNFTKNGCTPCACDRLGSENFVCDAESGQCECKRDVEGRTCDHCRLYYYGIHTGQGCTPCNCNSTGSLNLTCDDITGKCYCKPGVEDVSTDKCDRCQENYFNFTQEGCQACNCNTAGSRSLQCHHSSGECPCKIHATGTKCSQCMLGTFSLEEENPSGCIPCFCFNRSRQCSTASRYNHSQIKHNNLTIPAHGYVRLSRSFHGYHLYSYVRSFEVNFTGGLNISQIQFHLKGVFHNASFTLNTTQCPTPERGRYCVILHEKYAQEDLSANQMQSILADINEASVSISGDLGNGTELSVAMGTAIRSRHGNLASHVEQCECPSHYRELSCQNCNTGFTRNIPNYNAFVKCVLCSCNNRSKDCDGESGVCEDCRLSTGDHCETCGYGVDLATGCTQCSPEYWHPDIAKEEKRCRACNCVLENTLYHNSSVCNGTNGQCLCKSYVGGRQCERCAENYFNASTHGCRLCPECYGLLKVHVHRLRDFITEVDETVKQLENKSKAIGDNEFGQRLTNAKTRVNNIYSKANMTGRQDPYNLNMTSDELNNLTSNVKNLTDVVEDLSRQERELRLLLNNTSNWTDAAYGSLQQTNISRPTVEDLRDTIESFVQPLERAKESMKVLNHTLWNIVRNLTITSESEQEKMSRVLAQAKTVNVNLNNNIKNISRLQNETQASLKYAQETVNASKNFSAKTKDVFDMTKDILKEVNRLTELTEENKNLTTQLNDSILSPSKEYESTISNASSSVSDAKSETIVAEKVLNNTESLLKDARDIQGEANAATDSATKTLSDAETTLKTLQNFQNISAEATRKASRSLELINSINVENNRSIKEIMNVSKSVRDGLAYTDEAMVLADEAKRLSYVENQGITSVYNRSKVLDNHRKSTNCSRDLMRNYNERISARSSVLKTLLETCPAVKVRNVNDRANESLTRSQETLDDSVETNQDVKTIQEGVLESGTKVEEIENAVTANTHQSRLDKHSELFQELRTELSKLRKAKEKRAVLIKQMKERVQTMTLEIQDLQSLRDSLQNLPLPCT